VRRWFSLCSSTRAASDRLAPFMMPAARASSVLTLASRRMPSPTPNFLSFQTKKDKHADEHRSFQQLTVALGEIFDGRCYVRVVAFERLVLQQRGSCCTTRAFSRRYVCMAPWRHLEHLVDATVTGGVQRENPQDAIYSQNTQMR